MHTNWLQRIRQNEAMAKRLEREIPAVLGDPAITFDHAKRMIEAINQHSAEVERLMNAVQSAEIYARPGGVSFAYGGGLPVSQV